MSSAPPRSPDGPRSRWWARTRLVAAVVVALSLVAGASACVGQKGRNDDHVGPTSLRPDARPRS